MYIKFWYATLRALRELEVYKIDVRNCQTPGNPFKLKVPSPKGGLSNMVTSLQLGNRGSKSVFHSGIFLAKLGLRGPMPTSGQRRLSSLTKKSFKASEKNVDNRDSVLNGSLFVKYLKQLVYSFFTNIRYGICKGFKKLMSLASSSQLKIYANLITQNIMSLPLQAGRDKPKRVGFVAGSLCIGIIHKYGFLSY